MEFRTGFPPALLDRQGKNTVDELGIRAGEVVMVKISLIEAASSSTAKKPAKKKAKAAIDSDEEETANTTSLTRSKRSAAAAATSSFKEVIKAQEAMMKDEKKPKKSTASNSRISTINNIATLSSPRKASVKRQPKMEGMGYRLSDSQAVGSPSKRAKRTNTSPMFSSKDDIAATLLSSLSGKGQGNLGNFLRAAMKGAVLKSYEVSKAQVRVSAVQDGDYTMEPIKGGSVVDGGVVLGSANDAENALGKTMYQVSYGKGIEGRGRFTEQVEIIGLDALKSTIRVVYNSKASDDEHGNNDGREMLRPAAIAQMSPRMFWSLVYHSTRAESPTSSASSVESMLRETMPDLDWAHLDRGGRKRNLSEKAKENLRQEKKAAAKGSTDNNEDEVKALEELEDTILNGLDAHTDEELRQKRLAALSRFDNQDAQTQDDWKLLTPTDEDEDELKECIMDQEDISDELAKSYSSIMMNSEQSCCRNWRELANASAESLASKFHAECIKLKIASPSLESIGNWIDAAQQRSLEEIMLEILDSDQDALELLVDKANSGNPWDLTQWSSYPQLLLNTFESTKYNIEDASRWISRAHAALDACKWLEDYSVSVV